MPAPRLPTRCTAMGVLLLLASNALAQSGDDSGQAYLRSNQTQQEIFLRRQLNAQRNLVDNCIPELSVGDFRAYFNGWLAERPGFLSRPVTLSLTSAISDRCAESVSE